MATKKFKIPKKLGTCADRMYEIRKQKSQIKKAELDPLDEEYKALKEYTINTLPKSEALGVSGKVGKVTVVSKEVPTITDKEELYKYIKKYNAWDLLSSKVVSAAVNARWEDGKEIPGVGRYTVVDVSLTKV